MRGSCLRSDVVGISSRLCGLLGNAAELRCMSWEKACVTLPAPERRTLPVSPSLLARASGGVLQSTARAAPKEITRGPAGEELREDTDPALAFRSVLGRVVLSHFQTDAYMGERIDADNVGKIKRALMLATITVTCGPGRIDWNRSRRASRKADGPPSQHRARRHLLVSGSSAGPDTRPGPSGPGPRDPGPADGPFPAQGSPPPPGLCLHCWAWHQS
ncbi:hypothetical protein NDU88_005993 [Pleurodeles waltl]|uniref:Uncharacterized protein n=1 Tax=Pleurodeles waltl TaxID=8319 RepID=A0AAV7WDF3_PLEWA|nr:hypothetical protein NDU88_005993 [Pleurodeles waltl]